MNRREFLRYSAGGLAALAVGSKVPALMSLGCAPAKMPGATEARVPPGYEQIRMVGSSIGSELTTTVMSLGALLQRHYPEIEWSSVSGAAGTNPIYLTKGTVKLAAHLVSNYIDAFGFDKIPESRLRSIAAPRGPTHYFFIIPEDKPWKDITQVPKGATLCPGTPGTTLPVACEAWLSVSGLSKKDFNWVPLGKSEMADAWRAGKLDLVFTTVSGMSPALMDMYTGPRRFKAMGLSPEQVDRAKAEQAFERIGFSAPAKSILTQVVPEVFKEDVICTQGIYLLNSRDDFPDEIAYKMAKVFDEQHAELVQISPAMKHGTTPQWHIQWAKPPLDIHPGVARYYRDKGYLK